MSHAISRYVLKKKGYSRTNKYRICCKIQNNTPSVQKYARNLQLQVKIKVLYARNTGSDIVKIKEQATQIITEEQAISTGKASELDLDF